VLFGCSLVVVSVLLLLVLELDAAAASSFDVVVVGLLLVEFELAVLLLLLLLAAEMALTTMRTGSFSGVGEDDVDPVPLVLGPFPLNVTTVLFEVDVAPFVWLFVAS
jgi:hypothetical protein